MYTSLIHPPYRCLSIGLLLVCVATSSACSFDIPSEFQGSGEDAASDLVALPVGDGGRDMMAPRDLTPGVDANPGEDMPSTDMPTQEDEGNMTDLDMRPDLVVRLPAAIGERCEQDPGCAQGSCVMVAGESLCVLACVQGNCTAPDFGCIEGFCVPDTFCGDDGTSGPGCLTCERCDEAARCNEIVGGNGQTIYQCLCPDGYFGDGLTCIDRNECTGNTSQCDANATCTNTPGSFDCLCNPGFMGNGKTCTPMPNTCDMCNVQATCITNSQNMDLCACNAGWVGNGVTCQDLNECSTPGEGQCPENERCVNLPGTYSCECASGYTRIGANCQDINECNTSPCDALATCTNTPGNFQCDCPVGVAGNGITCQPYASCKEIAAAYPNSPSGDYWIRTTNGTQLEVWCDMVSDNGVGYTLHRVDDASLQTTQQAYASACTSLGMEIVTPRSQQHMEAIISWNSSSPPNIVNVFPTTNNARGLNNWSALCSGQFCSFFINGKNNSRCRTLRTSANGQTRSWSNGEVARSCYEYLEDAGAPGPTGSYTIDPDGPMGARPPFTTLCATMLDGGGWTLAATTSDDNQDTWTWDARTLWTSNEANVGSAPFYNKDYKNAAVHDLLMRDIAFYHEPSQDWASYHNVATSPGQTISTLLGNAPSPECDPNSGFAMTQGTLTAGGNLCSTNLYLHAGDYDQDNLNLGSTRCGFYRGFGSPRDESTWGFGWSQTNDHVCPFDDPAYSSWGANQWVKDEEANGVGFGLALGLNTLPAGQGLNYMNLLLRGERPLTPQGDNSTTQRLILENTDAGADCPHGSWDDRGNQVLKQGWVICGINP